MTTAMTHDSPHRNIQVYLLAAPGDQDICEAIHKHLLPIVKCSTIPIEVNDDFHIPIGEDREKYKQRLFDADITLALISIDFIDDEDTYSRTQKVIERYNNDQTKLIIPILIRNCVWEPTPFAQLTILPKNLQPLNNKQFWNSQDDALTAVVSDIYDSINTLTLTSQTNPKQQLSVEWRKDYYWNILMKRGCAILLDQLFLFFAPFLLLGFIIDIPEPPDRVLFIILLVIYFIVTPIMESSRWRGTIGKRMLKLQITDKEGQQISFLHALWRSIIKTAVLYSYCLIIPAVIQYFRFKKKKKLFHDELSNTIIGKRLPSSRKLRPQWRYLER